MMSSVLMVSKKYPFTDADAGDLPANEASDDDNDEEEDSVLRQCLKMVS